MALQFGTNYCVIVLFLRVGLSRMAFSKEATGSEPERDEKTEASEDSGEPFMFTIVSVFTESSREC